MTLLSRKADYALLILSHLHQQNEGANARIIADRYGLSRPFVANILKELCQLGYVVSSRGVKGGYSLLRPANQVTLAKLLESIEEGFQLTVCNQHRPESPQMDNCSLEHVCPMKGPLAEINRRILGVLRSVTLAELFEPQANSEFQNLLPLLTLPKVAETTLA